jgi:hypothetical protein
MTFRNLIAHPRFLSRVLLVDAVATGATAALLLAGAELLQPLLQLPAALLRGAGLFLVPFVVWVAAMSRMARVPPRAMAAVVAINAAWVVASVWLVAGGPYQPNVLGIAFVLVQAAAVAVFADLGWFGLRAVRRAQA